MQNPSRGSRDWGAIAKRLSLFAAAVVVAWCVSPPLDQTVLFKQMTLTFEEPGEELPLDGRLAAAVQVAISGKDLAVQANELLLLEMGTCTELSVLSGDVLPKQSNTKPPRRTVTLLTTANGTGCHSQLRVESLGSDKTPRIPPAFPLGDRRPLTLELPVDRTIPVLKRVPAASVVLSDVKREEGGDLWRWVNSRVDRLSIATSDLRLSLEVVDEDTTREWTAGRAVIRAGWTAIPSTLEVSGTELHWLWLLMKLMMLAAVVGGIQTVRQGVGAG